MRKTIKKISNILKSLNKDIDKVGIKLKDQIQDLPIDKKIETYKDISSIQSKMYRKFLNKGKV